MRDYVVGEEKAAAKERRYANSAEFHDMSDEMSKYDSLMAQVRKTLIAKNMAKYDERWKLD